VYEVGGLGAATLIRRSALLKGVNFDRIRSLDMWGEDKHFCVRAACLGIRLFVSTKYPLFHMYRPEDVSDGRKWLERGCSPEEIQRLLDAKWEYEVKSWFEKGQGQRKRSVRYFIGSGLRRVARFIESG
jgi:GT2 family glycosyltransferase